MEFKMNERMFTIKKVSQDKMFNESKLVNDGTSNFFGKFLPYKQEIWLDENLSKEQERKTLIHELTHCYFWCYMTEIENMNEEDVCNIHSNCHDIINLIISAYFYPQIKGGDTK